MMKRVASTARCTHETCNRAPDHLVLAHVFGCLCRAKPSQSTIFTFPNHRLDALTDLVGTLKLAFAPTLLRGLVLHFFLDVPLGRDPERAKGSLGLRSTLACGRAETGLPVTATSAAPSALLFGETVRDPERAKGSPGLRSTHGRSCSGCVAAACLANPSAVRYKDNAHGHADETIGFGP